MIDLEQAGSIYQLMTISALADGQMEPAEARIAEDLLEQFPELAPSAGALGAQAKAWIEKLGLDGALSEAASQLRDKEHRELAFVCCARLIEADRQISQVEFGVLMRLRSLFALDAESVARLLALAEHA